MYPSDENGSGQSIVGTGNGNEVYMARRSGRIVWVDLIRAISIICICMIHMQGVVYQDGRIKAACYFSVSLMLIITGYVTYKSNENRSLGEAYMHAFARVLEILVLYVLASVLYILYHERQLTVGLFWKHIRDFSASGPFYYFAFYLQYLLIGPLLVKLVKICSGKNGSNWLNAMWFGLIVVIATLCVQYSRLGNIFAGGNMLFGGTHLIMFYLGILLAGTESRFSKVLKHMLVRVLLTVLTVGWGYAYINGYLPFDGWLEKLWYEGVNPPGLSLMVLATLVMLTGMAWFRDVNNRTGLLSPITWIGQNTLFVFMFHILVMEILLDRAWIEDRMGLWWMKVLFAVVVIAGCVLAETAYKRLKGLIRR